MAPDQLHVCTTAALLKVIRGPLTIKELLLWKLGTRPGKIFSYNELVDGVWGMNRVPDYPENNLRQYIFRLRRSGAQIISHAGRGYSFHQAE